jgi:hypothetical protein
MIPQVASCANPAPLPRRTRRKNGFKPIAVSQFPDELVYRLCRVLRALPARFEGDAGVQVGELLLVRRSPHQGAPRSYWIEEEDGRIRAVITEDMFERDVEVLHV